MDLTALQTAIYRYGFDSTDPVTTWINAAIHEVETARRWNWLRKRATITHPASTETLSLPADFKTLIKLRDLTNKRDLQWYSPSRFDRVILDPTHSASVAHIFTMPVEDEVRIWPVPSKETSLDLRYFKTLAELVNGSDNIADQGFPERHHYAIVYKGAAIGLMAENEEDRAATAENQFQLILGRMITDDRLQRGEPEQAADVQGYFENDY